MSPHVLPFYGISETSDKSIFVSPLMENGNVRVYLQNLKDSGASEEKIFDIARGLKYLHDQKILHLDVKPANVLVDKWCHAMVADFGTSIVHLLDGKDHGLGSKVYMSPERLRSEPPTPAADVYAFGIPISLFEVDFYYFRFECTKMK
ncbi:kinase-like protein [Gonapodya prolifera JEL478]|uniref:Kinase-like protein n=1 Tax=Gonapodya prolifera (strain JEL478) TaxID=1344416 RepID=A0A139ADE2_GONPJ|nr:kinase-like protein [Gonapodya prolifera JEL478]|eukprot:KXS14679.1 kinase-like protein [Gonapodya prolifera JEL478]